MLVFARHCLEVHIDVYLYEYRRNEGVYTFSEVRRLNDKLLAASLTLKGAVLGVLSGSSAEGIFRSHFCPHFSRILGLIFGPKMSPKNCPTKI